MADRPGNVEDMLNHMRKTAENLSLPFGNLKMLFNSRLAQELGLWAESKDKGDAFHMAAFKANFVDGENIALLPVLLNMAHSVGLPREEAREVLEARVYEEAVDKDWALSRAKGITAVPTFVLDPQKLVGAQPFEIMEQFVKQNGVKRRP
jgi:predicted DsbA family dithiol-disulfide isomerase